MLIIMAAKYMEARCRSIYIAQSVQNRPALCLNVKVRYGSALKEAQIFCKIMMVISSCPVAG